MGFDGGGNYPRVKTKYKFVFVFLDEPDAGNYKFTSTPRASPVNSLITLANAKI